MRPGLFLVVAALAACTAVDNPPPASAPEASVPTGRLPRAVVPLSYELELTIRPERERFAGHTRIDLELREPTAHIFLHGYDLRVAEVLLRLADGRVIEGDYRQVHASGVAKITWPTEVQPQRATLELAYDAPFGRQLKGLYKVVDDGRAYAFTQFEPISAREAFPSFDEPAFKTPYDITLIVERGDTAITATPEIERMPLENGLERLRFATTAPLPSYLIAFAVGPLDVVVAPPIPASRVRTEPLPLRAAAAAGKGRYLAHALGTTPPLLALQEEYFDIAHPYPKLDLLAVPDFAAGAMENVGAITYRESLLLLRDDAPALQRRRHALVHAHELAHQWFGNLVTMPWWDDIWLNEAFATWMAYKTVAAWDPSQRAELSRLDRLAAAMREDSLGSARQIRQPVLDEHDIENAFDGITYSKGGAVLSMFERYLGAERFRAGIRDHLRRHAHGNADVDDFIASLARVGGEEIVAAMRGFIYQPGIPMLDVVPDCTAAQPALEVSQSRYRPIGSQADAGLRWSIPLCLRFGVEGQVHEQCNMIDADRERVELDAESCPDWILPNAGFSGYFHWTLPAEHYAPLLAAEAQLVAAEQMSISDSVYAGLMAGRLTVGEAANVFRQLARSERPEVALAPVAFIRDVEANLIGTGSQGLTDYTLELYGHLPGAQAFDATAMAALPGDSRRLFLVEVAELQAWAGDAGVRDAGLAAARAWLAGGAEAPPAEALKLAIQIAVEEDPSLAGRVIERLRASRDGHERATMLLGLARARQPDLLPQLYELALSDSIRINEIRMFIKESVEEPSHRRAAWDWLQTHFDALTERMAPRDSGRLPAEIAAQLCAEGTAEQARAFLQERMKAYLGGPRNVDKAIESARLCARRAALQRSQAEAYF